jgi:excisionase family DNA binding protein
MLVLQHCAAPKGSPMTESTKIAYSPREAAIATSLSLRKITRAISAGELKSSKIGRRRIIQRRDLEAFLAGAA